MLRATSRVAASSSLYRASASSRRLCLPSTNSFTPRARQQLLPPVLQHTRNRSNMGKPDDEVIQEFNELVNMSASELEKWLKTEESEGAGWGGESGETVGHDSGRKIVDILKRNPKKEASKYTDEDLQHMRKVVSYNKRHLAQEEKMKETKSKEELEQTKSVKSLRNWGHDPLKNM